MINVFNSPEDVVERLKKHPTAHIITVIPGNFDYTVSFKNKGVSLCIYTGDLNKDRYLYIYNILYFFSRMALMGNDVIILSYLGAHVGNSLAEAIVSLIDSVAAIPVNKLPEEGERPLYVFDFLKAIETIKLDPNY